jgi:DNA-directed RNA polymerase subunit RPC12/RpoP
LIRFKCIYCGQRILAKDDSVGKKGKCPKCRHELVVPDFTKGRPPINSDISDQSQNLREKAALASPVFANTKEDTGNDTGLENLMKRFGLGLPLPAKNSSPEVTELFREKAGWLIPTYDELSLFLMAATLILIAIASATMREQIYKILLACLRTPKIYIVLLIFLLGAGLSLYQVFAKRKKTVFEKKVMLVFAVGANIATAFAAGYYLIKLNVGGDDITPFNAIDYLFRLYDARDWRIIFPLWNFANAVFLILMVRFGIIDHRCIIDRKAGLFQVLLGMTAVAVIFLICNYVLKMYWAITFSICIVYTTSFDRALQSVFPRLAYRNDSQEEE